MTDSNDTVYFNLIDDEMAEIVTEKTENSNTNSGFVYMVKQMKDNGDKNFTTHYDFDGKRIFVVHAIHTFSQNELNDFAHRFCEQNKFNREMAYAIKEYIGDIWSTTEPFVSFPYSFSTDGYNSYRYNKMEKLHDLVFKAINYNFQSR